MYLGFLLRLAQICKNCTILGNLRTITRERKKKIRQMTPFFFIYFLSSNCLWYSFLYLKIAKIHFYGVLLSSILVRKIPEFGGVNCEIRILSRSIQKTYTLRKVKIQVLLFRSSWEPNLSNVMLYFCLFQSAILHRVKAKVLKF